jgi:hypothetical protein
MPPLMHHARPRGAVISCLRSVCCLPACTSWQVGTPTPSQFVEREPPERLLVTRSEGGHQEASDGQDCSPHRRDSRRCAGGGDDCVGLVLLHGV